MPKTQTNPILLEATGYSQAKLTKAKSSDKEVCSKLQMRAGEIRKFWKRERSQDEMRDYVNHHNTDLFRSQWECRADKRCLYSQVKCEVDKLCDRKEEELNERKGRLKELLENEKQQLKEEEIRNQPTLEQKKHWMRERYDAIIRQEENERQKVVKEKRDQQLRNNSYEYRELVSKKLCELTALEGKQLIEERYKDMEARNREDRLYGEMWLNDAKIKEQKSEEEKRIRKDRNMEFANFVKQQMESKGSQAKCADTSRETEALLMAEYKRLMEVEDEWERTKKKMNQENVRKYLEESIKDKMRRKAEEREKELKLDLYFLDKIISVDEKNKELDDIKRARMKEQKEYMEYLANCAKEEAEFQKHIEDKWKETSEEMWERREKQWQKEKQMRDDINKKALRECYEQIRNRLEESLEVQKRKMEYDEQVKKQAEKDLKDIEEERRNARENNMKYREELLKQMKEHGDAKLKSIAQIKKEKEEFVEVDQDYENKVADLLANVRVDNKNPMRSYV